MTADPILSRFDPFEAAVADYLVALDAGGKAPATIVNCRRALARFRAFAGTLDPAACDATLLRRWLLALSAEGLSAATQAKYLVVVGGWLRWLDAEGIYGVEAGFLARVKPPALDSEQPVPFADAELVALFAGAPRRTATGRRLRAIMAVLADAGLRAGELCGLRLADVDLGAGDIHVRAATSKGRAARTVALGRRARQECGQWWLHDRRHLECDPETPFFCGRGERAIEGRTLHRLIARHGARCGVADCYPHRFRHTFAIGCLRAGLDAVEVQKLLGHRSLAMTLRYIHLLSLDVGPRKRARSPLDRLAGL